MPTTTRPTTCIEPGCDRKPMGRGLCRTHYGRHKRAGDLDQVALPPLPRSEAASRGGRAQRRIAEARDKPLPKREPPEASAPVPIMTDAPVDDLADLRARAEAAERLLSAIHEAANGGEGDREDLPRVVSHLGQRYAAEAARSAGLEASLKIAQANSDDSDAYISDIEAAIAPAYPYHDGGPTLDERVRWLLGDLDKATVESPGGYGAGIEWLERWALEHHVTGLDLVIEDGVVSLHVERRPPCSA